jgi:hypothetical protein
MYIYFYQIKKFYIRLFFTITVSKENEGVANWKSISEYLET